MAGPPAHAVSAIRLVLSLGLVACAGSDSPEGRWELDTSTEGYVDSDATVLDYPLERDGRTVRKAMLVTETGVSFEDLRAGGDLPEETVLDGPFPWTRDELTDEIVITGAADSMRCTVVDELTTCRVVFESPERADFVMDQAYSETSDL